MRGFEPRPGLIVMRKIVHLSDLHFGRNDAHIVEHLFSTICQIQPHFTIISGDLTQRATARQFEEARSFLERLESSNIPYLVIPGNHDIAPIHRPLSRIFNPYGNYRAYISNQTEVYFNDEEVAIASINTVRASLIANGHVAAKQLKKIQEWFNLFSPSMVRILVTHHPLHGNNTRKYHFSNYRPAWNAKKATKKLSHSGVDIYLSGHLHRSSVRRPDALSVHAGTVSKRQRHEGASFNVLTINIPHMTVERYRWQPAIAAFSREKSDTLLIKGKKKLKDS